MVGYAANYNRETVINEGRRTFTEVIRPGAFKRAVDSRQDVRALINHDDNLILGRTVSGTLRLSEDAEGLRFECDLPDTQAARDLVQSIARGDIDGCSFGFGVPNPTGQRWNGNYRELLDVDLFDVSVTATPAYKQTSVGLRATENWKYILKLKRLELDRFK